MSPKTSANWIRIIALIFGIYALLWSLAPFPHVNLPARFILDISDWPIDNLSAQLTRNTTWLVSIASGLLMALAIFLGFIVAPALQKGDKQVARVTLFAFVAWYIVDGIGSIASGVGSNVVFNTIYLILALPPLILMKSEN